MLSSPTTGVTQTARENPPHRPQFLSRFQVITNHSQCGRNDHLFPTGDLPDDRRTIVAGKFGTVGLPDGSARLLVYSHQERVGVVVLNDDDAVVDNDRRRPGPEVVVERTHWQRPKFVAVAVVAEQAGRAEQAGDNLSVGHRTALRVAADLVNLLERAVPSHALPEHLSGFALQRNRHQLFIADRCQVNAVLEHNRRRMSRRHGKFSKRRSHRGQSDLAAVRASPRVPSCCDRETAARFVRFESLRDPVA